MEVYRIFQQRRRCLYAHIGPAVQAWHGLPECLCNLHGKFEADADIDNLTRHVDLFPTLAEIAGAKIPENLDLDGRRPMPLLSKTTDFDWADRYQFFHKGRWNKKGAGGRWGKGQTNPDEFKYRGFAVRTDKWRVVGKGELYDIENDPGETANVIEQHPQVANDLLEAYDA